MVKQWPNIESIEDISTAYRSSIAAIFKCEGHSWKELISGKYPDVIGGTLSIAPSKLGGYELICDSNRAALWYLSSLPQTVFKANDFSVIACSTECGTSGNYHTICGISEYLTNARAGWALRGEQANTNDIGITAIAVADETYTSLESVNVKSFAAHVKKSNNNHFAITDEGYQELSTTNALATGVDSFSIGAIGSSTGGAFTDYFRGRVGPYIIIFNKALERDQVEQITQDPHILVRNRLLEMIPTWAVSAGSGAFELTADSGTYTYTGTAASLERGLQLAADSGSYTYTGTAATLARGYSVTADAGAYTYTGTAAGLTATRTIGPDAGSYTYTGTDATLTYTPATGAYNLAADAGSYTYTGTAATLARSRVFGVDSGSYTYTGTAAALARGFNVGADAGAYTYTGTAATFDRIYSLASSPGSYTISGTSVILTIGGRTLTPSVIYSVEPRQQTFLVNPQRQVFHGRLR